MKFREEVRLRRVFLCAALVCFSAASALAVSEGTFQRTLQVTGAVNLEVETGSGSIQVRTGTSHEVQIVGRVRATTWFGGDAEEKVKRLVANPPIQQSGNIIRIGHITDFDLRRNVSISFELVVPAETTLRAHSGSGSENIDGVRGTVDAESGSGSLKISNIDDTVH